MKHLKKFESFNINETAGDMMTMPVDPIKGAADTYKDIYQSLLNKLKSITDFNKLVEELKKNPEEAEKIAEGLKDEKYNYFDTSGWDEKKITSKEYWIDKFKSWGVGAIILGHVFYVIIAGSVAIGSAVPTIPEIIVLALIAAGFGGLIGDFGSGVRREKK